VAEYELSRSSRVTPSSITGSGVAARYDSRLLFAFSSSDLDSANDSSSAAFSLALTLSLVCWMARSANSPIFLESASESSASSDRC
jgi:hypothetical protein